MAYPLVSIVSIFLNDAMMLNVVMDSILNQSYSPIQHVISIGASKDDSAALLKEYEFKYHNNGVKLTWTDKPDKCIAEAYNNCFRLIDGACEYALILTNPYMTPDSLKTQMDFLLSGNYDGVFCGAIMQKNNKIIRKLSGGGNPKHWRLGWQGTTEAFIFSRRVLDETGYFNEVMYAERFGEDFEYFLRIVMSNRWKLGTLKMPIVNYIGGGNSNTRNLELAGSFYKVLKDKRVRFAWFTVLCKCLRVVCRGLVLHKQVPSYMRIDL